VTSPTMSRCAICPPDSLVCLSLSQSRNTVSIPTCSLAHHDPLRSFPSCLLSSTKKSLSLLHITTKPSLFLYPIQECGGLQSGPPSVKATDFVVAREVMPKLIAEMAEF
jgi:hypothetical protein